jgi:mono/diheme cytochrome c family protein
VAVVLGAYFYVKAGGVQMAVASPEFPFEAELAEIALHASFASSLSLKSPVPPSADDLTAGAQIFKTYCAGCHGLPGKPSSMGRRMFPPAPQLLDPNGIRLSGMPEFKTALSETQRWQVAMTLNHADKLPPAALAVMSPR